MSKPHAIPVQAVDLFAVVDLSGYLYLGGLFSVYADAKEAAESMEKPAEIVRYSVPVAADGKPCLDCYDLIIGKYKRIATKDIEQSHRLAD